jgi:hypothetical protein
MIADMELRANQKLLEQLRARQQHEDLKHTRDEFARLQQEADKHDSQLRRDWEQKQLVHKQQVEYVKAQIEEQTSNMNKQSQRLKLEQEMKALKLEQERQNAVL